MEETQGSFVLPGSLPSRDIRLPLLRLAIEGAGAAASGATEAACPRSRRITSQPDSWGPTGRKCHQLLRLRWCPRSSQSKAPDRVQPAAPAECPAAGDLLPIDRSFGRVHRRSEKPSQPPGLPLGACARFVA